MLNLSNSVIDKSMHTVNLILSGILIFIGYQLMTWQHGLEDTSPLES